MSLTYTLSDIMQEVLFDLGLAYSVELTGGSTTTAVAVSLEDTLGDESFKDGALIVIKTTDGLAPQGEFARITDYDDNDGTFTHQTLTAALGAGDIVAYSSSLIPFRTLIERINSAIRSLGDILLTDTTTLDTASSQTEYACSVDWKRGKPLRIDIQTNTGDANDNQWVTTYDWEYIPAAPGSAGLIVFGFQPIESRDIRVWYADNHPRLSAYSDVLDEAIAPELANMASVERAMRWIHSRERGGDRFNAERLNEAKVNVNRAMMQFPVRRPPRKPNYRFTDVGYYSNMDDIRNYRE